MAFRRSFLRTGTLNFPGKSCTWHLVNVLKIHGKSWAHFAGIWEATTAINVLSGERLRTKNRDWLPWGRPRNQPEKSSTMHYFASAPSHLQAIKQFPTNASQKKQHSKNQSVFQTEICHKCHKSFQTEIGHKSHTSSQTEIGHKRHKSSKLKFATNVTNLYKLKLVTNVTTLIQDNWPLFACHK